MSYDLEGAGGEASRSAAGPVRRRTSRRVVGPFPLGDVLGRSFTVFARHAAFVLPVAILCQLPVFLMEMRFVRQTWQILHHEISSYELMNVNLWSGFVLLGLKFGMPQLIQVVITYAVFQALSGSRVSYTRSAAVGLKRSLPALLAALLMGLLLIAMIFALGFAFALFGIRPNAAGGIFITVISLVVGFTIWTAYYVAVQAAIVERGGPFRAMGRSASLTRGFRWKIVAILLAFFLLASVLPSFVGKWTVDLRDDWSTVFAASCLTHFVSAVAFGASAVAAAVTYHHLRRAKEGVGVDELLKVFA